MTSLKEMLCDVALARRDQEPCARTLRIYVSAIRRFRDATIAAALGRIAQMELHPGEPRLRKVSRNPRRRWTAVGWLMEKMRREMYQHLMAVFAAGAEKEWLLEDPIGVPLAPLMQERAQEIARQEIARALAVPPHLLAGRSKESFTRWELQTATGARLDEIGGVLKIPRGDSSVGFMMHPEPDDQYRRRLQRAPWT